MVLFDHVLGYQAPKTELLMRGCIREPCKKYRGRPPLEQVDVGHNSDLNIQLRNNCFYQHQRVGNSSCFKNNRFPRPRNINLSKAKKQLNRQLKTKNIAIKIKRRKQKLLEHLTTEEFERIGDNKTVK